MHVLRCYNRRGDSVVLFHALYNPKTLRVETLGVFNFNNGKAEEVDYSNFSDELIESTVAWLELMLVSGSDLDKI